MPAEDQSERSDRRQRSTIRRPSTSRTIRWRRPAAQPCCCAADSRRVGTGASYRLEAYRGLTKQCARSYSSPMSRDTNDCRSFRLRDVANDGILAGALTGRRILARLLERIETRPEIPKALYLDFEGIEIATASCLRECILEFRTIVRRRWTNYYPVVANANDTVTDELRILLPKRDVLMLCSLDHKGRPNSPRLLGNLEPKQRITYDLVSELGETDARELMRGSKEDKDVGQTAWNNRLASLCRLGLLMEISHGRKKRYRPLPLED